MMNKMSEDELRWRRRDDARTLARAEEIRADKERMKGAKIGAEEILKEENERLSGLAKVAGQKTVRVTREKAEKAEKAERLTAGSYPVSFEKARPTRTALPADIPACFRW